MAVPKALTATADTREAGDYPFGLSLEGWLLVLIIMVGMAACGIWALVKTWRFFNRRERLDGSMNPTDYNNPF